MKVQTKICGLTRVEEALACAQAGADAIGLVFYPPSPRHVSVQQAKSICLALPSSVATVGVFVDPPGEEILLLAKRLELSMVQLHGNETPETVRMLQRAGLKVIKALRSSGDLLLEEALQYADADALLVEASRGVLPGGNGASWDWALARPLADKRSFILAGGLNAENVVEAIRLSGASAVDLSSGAESSPGSKDLDKVHKIIQQVRSCAPGKEQGAVFS
ncbi:MAG TPA: phosphoribosylanthranilate isomerase [Fibrobacteraceae bacterium]|nr:phosphoribosylanthranilate isomerase [Fibrobacteraceae bacterium]